MSVGYFIVSSLYLAGGRIIEPDGSPRYSSNINDNRGHVCSLNVPVSSFFLHCATILFANRATTTTIATWTVSAMPLIATCNL